MLLSTACDNARKCWWLVADKAAEVYKISSQDYVVCWRNSYEGGPSTATGSVSVSTLDALRKP